MNSPWEIVGEVVELRAVRPWWKPGRRRVVGRYLVCEARATSFPSLAAAGAMQRELTLCEASPERQTYRG